MSGDNNDCKGLFWRARISSYLTDKKQIGSHKKLVFLKSKSCTGCKHCHWFWEHIQDELYNIFEDGDFLNNITDGVIYTFSVKGNYCEYNGEYETEPTEFIKVEEQTQ